MDAATFAARRARVLERLGGGALIVPSAPEARRNGDSEHAYRQESDLLYLTGFPEPESLLVLNASAAKPFTLFVRPKDRDEETWTGRRAGLEGAKDQFGADEALDVATLDAELPKRLLGAQTLWYATGVDAAMDARILRLVSALRRKTRQGVVPLRLAEPGPVLHELRLVKGPEELAALREAARLTADGHRRAMAATRPGVHEYELEAELLYAFRRGGGDGPGYTPIVAAGDNATILHYRAGRTVLREGELVLVDAGCEVAGYTADVTRTWPANGRFSRPQQALYELVLEARAAAVAAIRPGAQIPAVHELAARVIIRGLLRLGLLKGEEDQILTDRSFRRFFMHGTSHWLGLDVHDVGGYFPGNAPRPLAPGHVLTVEPGVYVRRDEPDVPDEFRGIGIRVEDDVAVTADGCEVLTDATPRAVADVERAVRGG